MPNAPEFLAADARAEWDRVSAHLYPLQLPTEIDVSPIAAYCQAYGRWVIGCAVAPRLRGALNLAKALGSQLQRSTARAPTRAGTQGRRDE